MSGLIRDPVYQQLHDALQTLVRKRDFRPGDRFLTERQIAERFDVSRATANKALSGLVSEGILEFRKGIGTFVRAGGLDYDLQHLVSFTRQADAAGRKPSTRVVEFRSLVAAELEAPARAELRVEPTDPLFFLERVRKADELPVILERRWIVARLCPKLSKTEVRGSLYSAWSEKHGLDILGADETIRAVNLTQRQAELLDVLPQTAAIQVVSVGFTAGDVPLWREETLYRSDVYEFRNRLSGLPSARPAVGGFRAAAE